MTADHQGSPPPPPAALDRISWAIEPRSNSITAEQMQNLSVQDKAFADLQPVGVDPYAVSPANRGLTNGRGLAQAIERATGQGCRSWCQATVDNRPGGCLDNGEVVSDPYHLRSKGYAGMKSVAMEDVSETTNSEDQRSQLLRYYKALFQTAYNQRINNLVMSLFGVGQYRCNSLISVWCFFEVFENLPTEQLDQIRVTILVLNHGLANTVLRAQMESWPPTQRHGWGSAFFAPSAPQTALVQLIVDELGTKIRNHDLIRNLNGTAQGANRSSRHIWDSSAWSAQT